MLMKVARHFLGAYSVKRRVIKSFIPAPLCQAAQTFKKHGFSVYLVGGAIRDIIRGRQPHDWDIATNAKPRQVMALFPRHKKVGLEFGTIRFFIQHLSFECTSFRIESHYRDARHPSKVQFGGDIHTDLQRRDFTMNAIAYDLLEDRIIDPFNGQEDIKHKRIKCVGLAEERFAEDALRILRVARFTAQLGFTPSENLVQAASKKLFNITKISTERARQEMSRLFDNQPSAALNWLNCLGFHLLLIEGYVGYCLAEPISLKTSKAETNIEVSRRSALYLSMYAIYLRCHDIYAENQDRKQFESLIRERLVKDKPQYLQLRSILDIFYWIMSENSFEYSLLDGLSLPEMKFLLSNQLGIPAKTIKDNRHLIRRMEELNQKSRFQNAFIQLKDLAISAQDLIDCQIIKPGPKLGRLMNQILFRVRSSTLENERELLLKAAEKLETS